MFTKYYVIDTNIILEDASNIYTLSDNDSNLLIIAETVLDELDSKKSGTDEINFQAREFARLLENATLTDRVSVDSHKIISIELNGGPHRVRIDMISKERYEKDIGYLPSNIQNDRKILEIAAFATAHYPKSVTFLSLDVMARIRASSLDIKSQSLVGNRESGFDYLFVKDAAAHYEDSFSLHGREIIEIDPEHRPHNFAYDISVEDADQVILTVVKNGKIELLDETEIRRQIITPMNKEQLYFSNAIIDPYYQIVVVEAKAGSGKTLLALSGAIKMVRKKEYRKIIYIRNSIESLDRGEEVGFLPGYEEKFRIYNHPLMDSLDYIVRLEYKRSKANKSGTYKSEITDIDVNERIESVILKYGIETMWVGEMRGRTLSEAVIIIDEAQNMSNKTMQMVLSRVDESCKVIVLGSNKQIDNFYINRHTNALTTLLKSTANAHSEINLFALHLHKVLRGPITEWAESIFSGDDKKS